MNWVAPIKDEETLEAFAEALKDIDEKYYFMFELGIGTGLQLQDVLQFKVKDVKDTKVQNIEMKAFLKSANNTKVYLFLFRQHRQCTSGDRKAEDFTFCPAHIDLRDDCGRVLSG